MTLTSTKKLQLCKLLLNCVQLLLCPIRTLEMKYVSILVNLNQSVGYTLPNLRVSFDAYESSEQHFCSHFDVSFCTSMCSVCVARKHDTDGDIYSSYGDRNG